MFHVGFSAARLLQYRLKLDEVEDEFLADGSTGASGLAQSLMASFVVGPVARNADSDRSSRKAFWP